MTENQHRKDVLRFFNSISIEEEPEVASLPEALYAVSELGLWFDDVDSVSEDQCLKCWRIVETLKNKEFPKKLWM